MSLQRAGASYILAQRSDLLIGRLLELGVGEDPYYWPAARTVSVDIDLSRSPDVVCDAHALPFRCGAFDSVLASQVLEHLHSPQAAVAEIGRVASGGVVVVAVPFLFWLHEVPHDYFRYTEWGLRVLFAGFDDVEIAGYGGRVATLIDLLVTATPSSTTLRRALRVARKQLVGVDKARVRPWIGRWLCRRVGEFPLGYVLTGRVRQVMPMKHERNHR